MSQVLSRNRTPNLLLRAQNLKVNPRSFELDINASQACFGDLSDLLLNTFRPSAYGSALSKSRRRLESQFDEYFNP